MNPPTLLISKKLIDRKFDTGTQQRGQAYYKAGRVEILTEYYDHFEDAFIKGFEAQVAGNYADYYTTKIEISSNNKDQIVLIESDCDCYVGSDCKHAAAVIYTLLARSEQQPSQTDSVNQWLAAFQSDAPQAPIAETGQNSLLYLLDFQRPSELTINVVKARRLKKGGFGKTRHADLSQSLYAFSDFDQECIRLIKASHGNHWTLSNFILKGKAGQATLSNLLQSQRCFWKTPDQPALESGPERHLEFEWRETKESFQLEAKLTPAALLFELNTYYYLDPVQHQIGQITSPFKPRQIQFLLKAPAVPKDRIQAIFVAINQQLGAASLPLPESLTQNLVHVRDPAPEIHLTLLATQALKPGKLIYLAHLAFDYQGLHLSLKTKEAKPLIHQNQQWYQVERSLPYEAQVQNFLLESLEGVTASGTSLNNNELYFSLPLGISLREHVQNWDRWFQQHLESLEAAGWHVHIDSSFDLNIIEAPEWDSEVQASSESHWFDLSLGIEVEGQRVNFLPILVDLLKQADNPYQILAELQQQEQLLLPLGQGQWIRIAVERVVAILSILIELYNQDALNPDGSLLFNEWQSLQMAPLLTGQVNWQGAEALKERLEKLQRFTGVETCLPPTGLQTELRSYQQSGLEWLQFLREFHFHGILADDMGLGKTVQTLAHLLLEKEQGRLLQPALIVMPTSLISNWQHEIERFTPDLKVLTLHGPNRHSLFKQIPGHDLILSTYPLIRRDQGPLEEYVYSFLILDEAQAIKNPQAKTSQAICSLKAEHRLCLSGTPLENHLGELWSLFHFLMPGFLGSPAQFQLFYRLPIEQENNPILLESLRQRVKPFLLRRNKIEVEKDLPAKTEITRYIRLNAAQQDLYETIRLAMDQRVRQEIKQKGLKRSQIMLLDALLKLRQICCHPQLLKLQQAQQIKQSAKLETLLEMLSEMLPEGRKILIFSQFVQMLDLIENAIQPLKVKYSRLTGQTRKRKEAIDAFQAGDAQIFLISIKAGGVGLNLTAADTVIHYDPWWNPAVENQATDRAWRIGQDKPVFVYKLIVEKTVEEKILALQARKQALSDGILSQVDLGQMKISSEELLSLLEAS